jgi:hypothetical protein
MGVGMRNRGKNVGQLRRKMSQRDSYDRVLIVCEGEKTEPTYFSDLIDHHALNTANVEVTGECGSSPQCVLDFAIKKFKESTNEGNAFDRVYCVIDRDGHEGYDNVVQKFDSIRPKATYILANSVPCFEYWLLLHHELLTKPYANLPGNSVGKQVLHDLKKHIPKYEKSCNGLFQELLPLLEKAKSNAKQALAQAKAVGTDNPTTKIHVLVDDLQSLHDQRKRR